MCRWCRLAATFSTAASWSRAGRDGNIGRPQPVDGGQGQRGQPGARGAWRHARGAAVAQAGAGARGADYAGFLARYLGDKTADPARPLLDQGLPFKTYEAELLLWLTQRYGYAGDAAEARAYFAALPAEQQRAFARQVYFAELRNSGREYNGKLAAREGSYLRGRQAIAALFPDHDAQGAPAL